jgi:hypothetical protein
LGLLQNASFAASLPKPTRLDWSGGAFAPSPLSKTWNQANTPGGSVASLLDVTTPPIFAQVGPPAASPS